MSLPPTKSNSMDGTVIPTAPLELYPTLNTLQEVLELARSQVPIHHQNQITSLLFTYHNTLLKSLTK